MSGKEAPVTLAGARLCEEGVEVGLGAYACQPSSDPNRMKSRNKKWRLSQLQFAYSEEEQVVQVGHWT